jgi:predicted ATPase/class 3 adenylate cyclase
MGGIFMKCPKCQFDNAKGIKFCVECGTKLEIICPKCGFGNLPSHKFCGECGHDFKKPSKAPPKDLTFDEKLTKIQRYLPKGLTEKILSQRDRIEGERKHVTVMFCDMEGFTQLSEKLGPEESYTIMDKVYEILIHKVHDYEGTVNEFTGDGIMALFGAPIALEDAPQRAIRSAYAIHREMTRFSDKVKQKKKNILHLKLRIGIHTGPVVVGTLGNDLRVEFKAVGDTVNLASRMEGLAEPASTYVTEDTYRLTEGLFRFEALGEYSVKGRADTVKAYRVIAPSTRMTRFDVSAERGLTPFIGRERELELLLDSFERSKAGRGQAFSIISEAGAGKSRLLYEFRKVVSNEDVTFMEGKCLSYSRGVAYFPVIDIVKSNFNIVENDRDFEIREKLKKGLEILDTDESATLPYLLELLSVTDSDDDPINLSPEARKDRIIEALNRITVKASQSRPVIMAIEDLHWIDKSSENTLKALFDNISGEKIFLIFTYRPEFVHTWGTKSYHNQINLTRLSNRESLEMVTYLLGTKEIDREIEELTLEKTEGIPFFIEEFIKSLKELKIIERKDNTYQLAKDIHAVTIPSTIQDVIMARVDLLPADAKELLQIGSVIEREFSYELIRRVKELPQDELLSNLSVLKDSELLYERGIYPESIYIFKHALTRTVVYDSILTKRKKNLHENIGNAIEDLYKNDITEHYGALTEHYIISENYEKAAEYSKLAGRLAQKESAFNEAIYYANIRVSCLEHLPRTKDAQQRIIDARTFLGLYYSQMNYHAEGMKSIESIIDLAMKHGNKRSLAQIYIIIGSHHAVVKEDFSKSAENFKKAIKISEEVNDFASLALASLWYGSALCPLCEFEKAEREYDRALNIAINGNSLWGIAQIKSMIALFLHLSQGKIDLARETSREAKRIAEKSGDIHSKAMSYLSYGATCYHKGLLEDAETNLLQGLKYCEKIDHRFYGAYSHMYLGDNYLALKDNQKAEYHYRQATEILRRNGLFPSWLESSRLSVVMKKIITGERDIDLELLRSHASRNSYPYFDGIIKRNLAFILLHINERHLSEADDWIKQAIESHSQKGTMWQLGMDFVLHAGFFKRKGDKPKAKEKLAKGIDILKECGADGWVEKYKKELAAL